MLLTDPQAADLADQQYVEMAILARLAADEVLSMWKELPSPRLPRYLDVVQEVIPEIVTTVQHVQYRALSVADQYFHAQATAQAVKEPLKLVPQSLLTEPSIVAQDLTSVSYAEATKALDPDLDMDLLKKRFEAIVARYVGTEVQEATLSGLDVLTRASSASGYVRQLRLPSCSRCAVLAGRVYHDAEAFNRHPLCDCTHVPVWPGGADDSGDTILEAIQSGKVTGLNQAEQNAILREGADPSAVINAKRGMSKVERFGRVVKETTEATTKRGSSYKDTLMRGGVKAPGRLTVDEIYKQFGSDRMKLRASLERFGYLTTR